MAFCHVLPSPVVFSTSLHSFSCLKTLESEENVEEHVTASADTRIKSCSNHVLSHSVSDQQVASTTRS